MNGDVLSTMDYGAFLARHVAEGVTLSIATHTRVSRLDYGVVQVEDDKITGYLEKPETEYLVSMGVYAFSPQALGPLTEGERVDFPELVLQLLGSGSEVRSELFDGFWLDIGRHEDFARAQEEFAANRARFLGDA